MLQAPLPVRCALLPLLQAVCRFIDSLPWSIFILLITLFAVFGPDIAILVSGEPFFWALGQTADSAP